MFISLGFYFRKKMEHYRSDYQQDFIYMSNGTNESNFFVELPSKSIVHKDDNFSVNFHKHHNIHDRQIIETLFDIDIRNFLGLVR